MDNPLDRQQVPCPDCGGSGKETCEAVFLDEPRVGFAEFPCETCDGSGSIPEPIEKTLERVREIALWLARQGLRSACSACDSSKCMYNEENPAIYIECQQARIHAAADEVERNHAEL